MKLLFYSHFFAPSIGGVESIVLSLASGIANLRAANGERPFELTLVTETPAENYENHSLPFRVIRQPGLFHLWQLVRASDLIHVAGPALVPLVLSFLARKPVVVEHHGFQTICPNGQLFIEPAGIPCPGHFMAGRHSECLHCNSSLGWFASGKLWFLTFVRRFLCAHAAANITPTAWLGSLLHLPRIQSVPHGLEITPAAPRLPAPSSAAPVIVFQGRLVTTKGTRLLFEAARILLAQNRSFELLVIGDGPERATLEQFATEWRLSPHLRFAGRLPAAQMEAALARTTVVVVPSIGGEVFGLVVAENMLRGLPVVASDLGAFVEVLGDAGLTFRTGDAADLAAKLTEIFEDPLRAARLGHGARRRVLNLFGKSQMVDEHAKLYVELKNG
ncbi:MAG: hypothetical protein PVS2B2_27980 [Candidatus Acidiferrum sp.]